MSDLADFIREVPKVELHLHLEGTLEPELKLELASRNEVKLPFGSVDELRAAYEFDDLHSFLDIYYSGTAVLREEADFYALTRAYLDRMHEENVRHVEVFFDPQTHTNRGIEFDVVIDGIWKALRDAESENGLTSRLIMCFLRDLSAESAMETLEHGLRFRDRITGIGLDSAEVGNPPSKFTDVFDRARTEDLRAVAHAGEEGPPDYITEALDLLGVERVDHGVRCLEDPDLVERLAGSRTPLTVCPLSNVALGVFDSLEDHNLKRLLDSGLAATVNSDDPAYFGGYLTENYLQVADALDLGKDDVVRLVRNSIEAAFVDDKRKAGLLADLAEVSERH